MNAIAIAILSTLIQQGGCDERAGVIIQNAAGEYRATDPIKGRDDSFELHVRMVRGEYIVALYHTHPACTFPEKSTVFSPQDVDTAQRLNVPSYIGVMTDKTVRVFDPAVDKIQSAPHDLRTTYGVGHIVLELPQ